MKICLKTSLFVLLVLLNYTQAVPAFGEIENKTSLDSCTLLTELGVDQPEIKEKGCIVSKESINPYTNDLLVDIQEERRKKTNKKSPYTANQRDDNPLSFSFVGYTSAQREVEPFIQSNIPLYKLFHSWKTHLL